MVAIRPATVHDHDRLRDLDRATFSTWVSPGTPPAADSDMFHRRPPQDYLVAEVEGRTAGFVMLGHPTSLPASRHVTQIQGLAVDPAMWGRGLGNALVREAIAEARRRGSTKISLRVLGSNDPARRVYDACGFTVEGVLQGEFMLNGQAVDDVFMALALTPTAGIEP